MQRRGRPGQVYPGLPQALIILNSFQIKQTGSYHPKLFSDVKSNNFSIHHCLKDNACKEGGPTEKTVHDTSIWLLDLLFGVSNLYQAQSLNETTIYQLLTTANAAIPWQRDKQMRCKTDVCIFGLCKDREWWVGWRLTNPEVFVSCCWESLRIGGTAAPACQR